MIIIEKKEDCCGCEVCANACPKSCIQMERDEKGFLYPKVDKSRCVDCHICEKVCPVAEPKIRESAGELKMYGVQNTDERVRMESTSGGAFSLIANWVLARQGIVIGAAFDENFRVIHAAADSEEGAAGFRGSKYVQSSMGDIYRKVKEWLVRGRWVCFSGTPCQVNGLYKFLNKSFDRLVTVDIACHGVTSPKFFEQYIRYHSEKEGKKIKEILFREKHYGYGFSTMKVGFEDGSCYRAGMETDILLRSFFMDLNTRESCHDCRFKTVERVSDFTVFDGWHTGRFQKDMEDDKGTTLCILQSDKANKIFAEIREQCRFVEIPVEEGVRLDGSMILKSTVPNPRREQFFKDISVMGIPEIQDRYYPITWKRRLLAAIKPTVYRLGLFKYYMKFKEKAGGK